MKVQERFDTATEQKKTPKGIPHEGLINVFIRNRQPSLIEFESFLAEKLGMFRTHKNKTVESGLRNNFLLPTSNSKEGSASNKDLHL